MKNFDCFIGIDWSGAKSPVLSRSIAVATCPQGDTTPHLLKGPWSRTRVAEYISDLIRTGERILIGIDANFGYEFNILKRHINLLNSNKPTPDTAMDLWALVDEASYQDNNYFAGGFLSHPLIAPSFWTEGPQPEGLTLPRRETEAVCQNSGFGKPESPFKLIGAKQVGKGGLAAMRMTHDLKQKHGDAIKIWPFEKNLTKGDAPMPYDMANIVITEIYPRQFIRRAGWGNGKIRNRKDLNAVLTNLKANPFTSAFNSDHDTDAIIAAAGLRYLCGSGDMLPPDLHRPYENVSQYQMEGWIFGAGYQKHATF